MYRQSIFIALISSIIIILTSGCGRTMPEGLGLNNNKLIECPDSPNCVSTQSQKEQAKMTPIKYAVNDETAYKLLLQVIEGNKLANIITKTNNYIHAAYHTKSKVFIDDVEFFIDADAKLIHFRSASRVGHSDLGANRKRMEKIKNEFSQQLH